MKNKYVLKTFAICCSAFLLVYSGFIITNFRKGKNKKKEIINQNKIDYAKTNYLSSKYNDSINRLIRLNIEIKDDLNANEEILEVQINNTNISLNAANSKGMRKTTYLQLKPGKYTISWTVKNNSLAPNRYSKLSKQLIIGNNTLIYVHIEGKKISIN